jgi:hypothetical protein
MHPLVRSILAILAGIIVGSVIIAALEFVGHLVYPLPEGLDPRDPVDRKALEDYVANAPVGSHLLLLLAYAVGTFVGAWLAAALAGRKPIVHGIIAGAFFLLATIANLQMIEHPTWFVVVNLVLVLPLAYAGAKLVR